MTRLLIAEDSSTQAAELRWILQSEGFEIEVAPDGARALHLVTTGRFDLVLSDIVMPGLSGYELCRAIKSNPSNRSLPVILLTTLSDPMDIIQGLECGADNFLTKPCEPDVLISRVRGVLESQRMRAEGHLKIGVEVLFLGRKFSVTSEKEQILGLLISTFEDVVRSNRDLRHSQSELGSAKVKLEEHARRLEGQARFSEDKYRALMDRANDAILIADERGVILQTNQLAEALFGLRAQEIVGRSLHDLVIPAERGYSQLQFRKLLDEGKLHLSDVRFVRKDGQPVYTDLSMSVVATDRGPVALLIARDMTEKIRLHRQILHNEKLATVGTLAAGVAHEINNPTAVLLGNLEPVTLCTEADAALRAALLARAAEVGGPLGDELLRLEAAHRPTTTAAEMREILVDCNQAAERIRDIVRDLKSFAHADEGDVVPVDVHERIDATLRMALNEIRHRARVEKRYAAGLPSIMANPGKLNQLFLNLVVNAAQALDENRAEQNVITIVTHRDGAAMHVEISDTGAGIPPEVLPRIFDPFFTTKPVGVGTGLGLSICHEIVKKHAGEIRVRSQLGKGTTFTIVLPFETGLTPARKTPLPGMAPGRRYGILLVDDDPSLVKVYMRRLGRYHDVTSAIGGRVALDVLSSGKAFDVILCDMMMPDVDGVDLHHHVTAHHPGLQDRIVFLTGGAFTTRAKDFLEAIPNPRLEKPFAMEDLLRAIDETAAVNTAAAS